MSWRVLINTITIFVIASGFVVWQYPELMRLWRPCAKPIAYAIGNFDKRFGISQSYFLSALSEAESIWEELINKELFVYAPETGELAVNLIYDYRQEVTSTLFGIESAVEEDEATYEALQARYEKLKAEYESAKSVYRARVTAFEERNEAYRARVESWNKGKRNSKEQFNQLEAEREALEKDAAELKVLESRLNEIVREINNLVGTLNHLADLLNLNAETYNTIGASRGESFTGGLYHSAEGEESIDIYEFSSREKLVRVLAHELGHALRLEHVDDPEAVMYYLNESNTRTLTKTDLAALKVLCGIE